MEKLESKAKWVRRQILEMIVGASKGHIGGSLSCADLLVALYQGGVLRVDPKVPSWPDRDRFIFSKGHACEAFYSVLADSGFFPTTELASYGKAGHFLGGHPDNQIPGVEVNSGSLGHGLGIGAGLALSARMDQKSWMTYVMMGDGECYEGSIWEAAMFAAHHQLSNLVGIVDRNRQITLEYTEDTNRLEPFADKWRSFGWEVITVDGHSFESVSSAFARIRSTHSTKPWLVLADTIKGKGISFMEKDLRWHHNVPKGNQVEQARKELAIP